MENGSTIRRHLAPWLVIWFLVQGLSPAIAGNQNRHQQPTTRVASCAGVRSCLAAPAANHFASGQPALPEVCFDFRPQWNISLLAKVRTARLGLLPADTARFGRAPPSSVP